MRVCGQQVRAFGKGIALPETDNRYPRHAAGTRHGDHVPFLGARPTVGGPGSEHASRVSRTATRGDSIARKAAGPTLAQEED